MRTAKLHSFEKTTTDPPHFQESIHTHTHKRLYEETLEKCHTNQRYSVEVRYEA
jgi:hypothetical protein